MNTYLLDGETRMKDAPSIQLKDGSNCVPQHFLQYEHTLESIQKVVLDCHYEDRFPLFVGKDNSGIYIQVGVIGYDNYRTHGGQSKKIVYGRKWRVEPTFPTSEIIQTVFLALKKAREHEVREIFKLSIHKKLTTPFSGHHDSPLLESKSIFLIKHSEIMSFQHFGVELEKLLTRIEYDRSRFSLVGIERRKNSDILIDLKFLSTNCSQLREMRDKALTLILSNYDLNQFLHTLIDKLVHYSNREIDENFKYKAFKRFSYKNSVEEISELSIYIRDKQHIHNEKFLKVFKATNYETDKSRVPVVITQELADKIEQSLAQFGKLDGVLPLIEVD